MGDFFCFGNKNCDSESFVLVKRSRFALASKIHHTLRYHVIQLVLLTSNVYSKQLPATSVPVLSLFTSALTVSSLTLTVRLVVLGRDHPRKYNNPINNRYRYREVWLMLYARLQGRAC